MGKGKGVKRGQKDRFLTVLPDSMVGMVFSRREYGISMLW